MEAMKFAMTKNKVLSKYDIKHNQMSDEGIDKLCEILEEAKHVQAITLSEWVSGEGFTKLSETLAKNKPTKGKKKKGKKKWKRSL